MTFAHGRTWRLELPCITAALLLSLAAVAYAGDGKIHRMPEKVPNSYIVMFESGQAADMVGPELEKRHGGKLNAVMKHLGAVSITLPNEAAAEAIAHDPRVSLVQEDGLLHAAVCCKALDPSGSQWAQAYLDLGPNWSTENLKYQNDIGSYLSMVQIYVIDGGIDDTVPDLRNNGQSKVAFGINVAPPDGVCSGSEDPGGPYKAGGVEHGTAVASVLGGYINGVVPEIPLIRSVVALNCSGVGSDTSISRSVDYVLSNHYALWPTVANISIVASVSDSSFDASVKRLVDSGVFVAGAAGNNYGKDACHTSPAELGGTSRYPGLMITGAVNLYGSIANYSNVGACVDVWAPGGETMPSNPYDRGVMTAEGPETGTSFAAPAVAGIAAAVYSYYPNWRPADVWAQMKYYNTKTYFGLLTIQAGLCHLPHGCPIGN
jgi:Subtilase family